MLFLSNEVTNILLPKMTEVLIFLTFGSFSLGWIGEYVKKLESENSQWKAVFTCGQYGIVYLWLYRI